MECPICAVHTRYPKVTINDYDNIRFIASYLGDCGHWWQIWYTNGHVSATGSTE